MSRSESTPDTATVAFEGYPRRAGVGVRNRVLVLPSVICSHMVADEIASRVDAAESAPHDHGCAQIGADREQTKRTFVNVGSNPNVAGTVVVGLGCEGIQSDEVSDALDDRGVPVREVVIQEEGGTDPCIERGVEAARDLVERAERTRADLGDLTVGVGASALAASTVETADPLVGDVVGEIVDAGGRVVVAGTERVLPHAAAVRSRTTDGARTAFDALVERRRNEPARASRVRLQAADRDASAATSLWDDRPIEAVLEYGERATHDGGVALVDAPSRFEEAATALAAAGAQVVVHVTGEGVPAGHPIVPVVKVTGDGSTYEALAGDIDVNANETTPVELLEYLGQVAHGAETRAERHGIREFAITRVGPSM